MEKNTNIILSLKEGDVKLNETKLINRNTILFPEGENINKIDIEKLYGKEFEEMKMKMLM